MNFFLLLILGVVVCQGIFYLKIELLNDHDIMDE